MFVVMYKTKSLLAAICVHGTYNVIVDYGAQMGWINMSNANHQLALTPIYTIGLVVLYAPFMILNIRRKNKREPC
jgi:pilus assembly protein TadC